MKYLLFICLVLSCMDIYSQQFIPANPDERAKKITEWMKTNLGLSEEQVTQVHQINLSYAYKNQGLNNTSMSKKQKLQYAKSNDNAKDKELDKILTSDQFRKYQTKKNEMNKRIKQALGAEWNFLPSSIGRNPVMPVYFMGTICISHVAMVMLTK